ncbi:hypothetical protein HPB47_009110 [Ixodes persulcatus]|uniref:Uncharacterized protein n=1 Tax=Ixodes persulcatus TaxID=34615 RepID=A0AC60P2Z1_IXOPE|nr:hypothetical protein HPB47_009110 [Ixodes persulcatus]
MTSSLVNPDPKRRCVDPLMTTFGRPCRWYWPECPSSGAGCTGDAAATGAWRRERLPRTSLCAPEEERTACGHRRAACRSPRGRRALAAAAIKLTRHWVTGEKGQAAAKRVTSATGAPIVGRPLGAAPPSIGVAHWHAAWATKSFLSLFLIATV